VAAKQKQLLLILAREFISNLSTAGLIADADGNLVYYNEAAERILGRSQDDVAGRPFGEVFDLRAEPDHGPLADRVLDVTDPGSPPTLPAATRLVTPAGDRLIEVAAAPIDDASGTGGVVVVFRDVTDARRAEAERRSIELRMQETQKLESLGVLAGGIAHDFNNLLVAILGNASLALADLPPASPIREHLEQIELASQRAADLARQMLAYSGRGRFVIEALDVNAVVREISQLLSVSVPKSTTMAYALDPGLPPIEGDPTQLRQVVLNLVVNAGEAIGSAGGTIRVRTALVDADARYLEGALMADELEPGRYVTLEISDTGCGMDADTRRRIFEPFFTTKFTGRGLGLAAVLGIIRGHRGAIRVYSEPGRGSSFKILLPAATATAGEARHKPPTTGWLTSGTVLIVDDEAAVRSLTARMLEPVGLDSVTASNGIEGVDRFRAEPDRFSLVLLDLTMPRLGGVEAFEAIRAIRPDIPVILMSGYAEEDASARFVGRGLRGFLQKPYSVEELISTVRGVLEAVPTAG
jgi:PAS domain S-box-containing protein